METPPPPPVIKASRKQIKVKTAEVKSIGPPPDEPLNLSTPLSRRDVTYWKYCGNTWTQQYEKGASLTLPQQFKVLSYNIEGIGKNAELSVTRFTKILSFIEEKRAQFVALQEVCEAQLNMLQESSFIQDFYFISTIDKSSFPSVHGIVTLSALEPTHSFIHELHSNGNRVFDVAEFHFECGHTFSLATYHLEGPRNDHHIRIDQINTVYRATEGANTILFAGDSNFHSFKEFPLEDGFVDVWRDLYPTLDGWTYDSVANDYCDVAYKKHQPGFINQHRLDRFIFKSERYKAAKMELLGTSNIGLPGVFPSDHFGIYGEFNCQ